MAATCKDPLAMASLDYWEAEGPASLEFTDLPKITGQQLDESPPNQVVHPFSTGSSLHEATRQTTNAQLEDMLMDLRVRIWLYNDVEKGVENESVSEIRVLTYAPKYGWPFSVCRERDQSGLALVHESLERRYPNLRHITHFEMKPHTNTSKELLEYEVTLWKQSRDQKRRFVKTQSWTKPNLPIEYWLLYCKTVPKDEDKDESPVNDLIKRPIIFQLGEIDDNMIEVHVRNRANSADPLQVRRFTSAHERQNQIQYQDWMDWRKTLEYGDDPGNQPISEFVSSLNVICYSTGAIKPAFIFCDRDGDGKCRIADDNLQKFAATYGKASELRLFTLDKHYTFFKVTFWYRRWNNGEYWVKDEDQQQEFVEKHGNTKFGFYKLSEFLSSPNFFNLSMSAIIGMKVPVQMQNQFKNLPRCKRKRPSGGQVVSRKRRLPELESPALKQFRKLMSPRSVLYGKSSGTSSTTSETTLSRENPLFGMPDALPLLAMLFKSSLKKQGSKSPPMTPPEADPESNSTSSSPTKMAPPQAESSSHSSSSSPSQASNLSDPSNSDSSSLIELFNLYGPSDSGSFSPIELSNLSGKSNGSSNLPIESSNSSGPSRSSEASRSSGSSESSNLSSPSNASSNSQTRSFNLSELSQSLEASRPSSSPESSNLSRPSQSLEASRPSSSPESSSSSGTSNHSLYAPTESPKSAEALRLSPEEGPLVSQEPQQTSRVAAKGKKVAFAVPSDRGE